MDGNTTQPNDDQPQNYINMLLLTIIYTLYYEIQQTDQMTKLFILFTDMIPLTEAVSLLSNYHQIYVRK